METRGSVTSPVFYVGKVAVQGDVILSPMDGYSDQPFRSLCRELGSAMSYTEFINALDILQGPPYIEEKLAFSPAERPIVFQLFDNDPDRLLEVALRVQEFGPDIIDINIGCAARNVAGRGAGAGLLRTPEKIVAIFQKLTHALETPVTAKIRLGWDVDSRNYIQVARIVEENGGALIAVHGRTRQQGYQGRADWNAIAEVVQAVSIPVIGNGDVRTVGDIERIKAFTGCRAVMIGRAAVGNPWIFSRLEREQVTPEQAHSTMLNHLERMCVFYGPQRGLVLFRKHAARYLRPYTLPRELYLRLVTTDQVEEFVSLLNQAL
jgi:tRNA-dihydrouridine synthase B